MNVKRTVGSLSTVRFVLREGVVGGAEYAGVRIIAPREANVDGWSRRRFMQVSAGAALVASAAVQAEEEKKTPHR